MSTSNRWQSLQSFPEFLKQLLAAHWRSLLVLLVGVCLPLLLFEQLALVIWQNQGGFPWDEPLLLAVHATAQPRLDRVASTLTRLGGFRGIFPVATVISLVLLNVRRWRSLTYVIATIVGTLILNRTVKLLLHRVRPQLWNSVSPEFDFAFPSGHAMASMTLIAVLIVLTWGSRWCWLVLSVGSVYVVAIAWTRLYLGVHFPSDILAGWLVAIAWSIGVSLLIRPHSLVSSSQTVAEDELQPE